MGKSEWMQDFLHSLDTIEREMCSLCGHCCHQMPCPPGCLPDKPEHGSKPPCPPGCRPERPSHRPKPPCGRDRFCCDL